MLDALKKETNYTLTENGAVTHAPTLSSCLDLFSTMGALRQASEGEIVSRFADAWAEDRDLAVKILFYTRDVRGGLGKWMPSVNTSSGQSWVKAGIGKKAVRAGCGIMPAEKLYQIKNKNVACRATFCFGIMV